MTNGMGADGVVESASATTSPDNANSGPAAYIITAAAIVVLALVTWGMTSCTASIISTASAYGRRDGRSLTTRTYGYDDYEEYLNEYLDELDNLEYRLYD